MNTQHTAISDAMILSGKYSCSTVAAVIGVGKSAIARRAIGLRSGRIKPVDPSGVDLSNPELAALLREEIHQLEIANELDRDRIRERNQWIAQKLQILGRCG